MQSFYGILAFMVALITTVQAYDNKYSDNTVSLPTCAAPCFVELIPESYCQTLTNLTCICMNAKLSAEISECVAGSCPVRAQLQTKKYSYDQCGQPVRDRTRLVSIIGVVGGVVACIAVFLRILARRGSGSGKWGWDDYIIIVTTTILVIPLSIISVVLAEHGLGKDMWQVYYADEQIYITSISLIKLSIQFFYLRIFPAPYFKKCVYILMALTILYCVIFDAISLFQCTPVSLAWTRWDGQHKGVCRNINAQIWSCAAINIALDAATLILPLPELYKLALSTRRKIQILAMFSVGFFVTIISVIRLEVLVTFGNTQNVTWDYTSIGYWSTLEVHVAVVCACMPAIRSLFQNVFPKVFGHTQVASTGKTTGLSTNASNGKIVTTQRSQRHHEDGDFIPLVDMDTGKNEDLEFGQRPPGSSYTTTHAQNAGSTPTLETINVNRDTKSNHAS